MNPRTLTPIAVFVLLFSTLGVNSVGATEESPAARSAARPQQDPPEEPGVSGMWTGTVTATVTRSTKMVAAGYTMEGDFWFNVDDDGTVDGYAVLVYEPFFDTEGINAALHYIKSVGTQLIGSLIPLPIPVGAITNGLLGDALAVRAEFPEAMTVVQGPIAGNLATSSSLGNGQLSIDWADGSEVALPVTVYFDLIKGSEEITSNAIHTESPWAATAAVTQVGGLNQAVSSTQDGSSGKGLTTSSNNTWSAHQG